MLSSLLQRLKSFPQPQRIYQFFFPCAVNGHKGHLFSSQLKSLEEGGGLGEGETFSKVSPSPRKKTSLPKKHLTPKQIIGQMGEDAAARLAKELGMHILARNWRKGRLELDIVCQDGDTIVFVEVKTRKISGMEAPYEALTMQKQRTLIRAAQAWLAATDSWHRPCRFDLICVLHNGTTFTTEHMPHAFEFTSALGRGHSAWQPW